MRHILSNKYNRAGKAPFLKTTFHDITHLSIGKQKSKDLLHLLLALYHSLFSAGALGPMLLA